MKYCVFEYLYRDAGNFKAWGELLLEGELTDVELARLTARFDGGDQFIAEQIGVPTLYEKLWQECRCAPCNELDQVWHEFSTMRAATAEDISQLKPWGTAAALLARTEKTASWDLTLSPNGGL